MTWAVKSLLTVRFCVAAVFFATLMVPISASAGTVMDWAGKLLTGCWSCDALGQILSIGLRFAQSAFDNLATEVSNLLGILMAIWILFLVAKMFLPFGPEAGVGSLWNAGAKKLLQFAFIIAMLQNSAAFWDYLFVPVMSAGMAFSKTIVTMTDGFEITYGDSETGPTAATVDAAKTYCRNDDSSPVSGVTGAIAIMKQMNCPLATIQSQFAKGMLVGIAETIGAPRQDSIAMLVVALVSGILLIAIYFFGMLLFPVFLIDVVMRLSIATAIAPIAMAAALFGPTKKMAEKVVWQIAHAALNLVFLSIVGGIGKATLAYVFANLSLDGVAAGAKNWNDLITLLEEQKTTSGTTFYIDMTTMSFYQLAGIGVILIFMLRQANKMAGEFSGGNGGDFSGALGGVAAMAGGAGYLAGKGGQMAMNAVAGGRGASGRDGANAASSVSRVAGRVSGADDQRR